MPKNNKVHRGKHDGEKNLSIKGVEGSSAQSDEQFPRRVTESAARHLETVLCLRLSTG